VDEGSGLISILGGKWTTYRVMAEDTINAVQSRTGGRSRPGATSHHLLAGVEGYAPDYWKQLAREHPIDESAARHLAQKFGTDAPAVLEIAKHRPELYAPITEGAPPIQAEVLYCIRQEMAVSIEDILSRRLSLQQYDWKLAMQAAPVVASHLASELGWSGLHKDDELRRYLTKIDRFLVAIGAGAS
jgi:glycerol-3-phosphate dehydrogenase